MTETTHRNPHEEERLGCTEALDRIEAWLDAADPDEARALAVAGLPLLDAVERRRLERHLATCPACAGEAEAGRRLRRSLRRLAGDAELAALGEPGAPGEEWQQVAEPAPNGHRPTGGKLLPLAPRPAATGERTIRHRLWRELAAVAATLLVAIGAFVVVESRRPAAPAYGPAEVDRATAEARYALALVARSTRHAGTVLEEEVIEPHLLAPAAEALRRGAAGEASATDSDRLPEGR